MSDITDCQNVSDHAVTVSVNSVCIFFDVIQNHLTLQFSTLVCIETYVISIFVEVQSFFVQFAGSTAGWLTVEPAQRFVLVFYASAR